MALRLNYRGMMADAVGETRGITTLEIDELAPWARLVTAILRAADGAGRPGFYRLPYDNTACEEVISVAGALRPSCEYLVVLGIGGSALGGSALCQALRHPLHNLLPRRAREGSPRVFFADNVDPTTFGAMLDFVEPDRTIFNVITKSGSTTETAAQFLIVHGALSERLGPAFVKDHLVVTTGEENNALRSFSEKAGFRLFSIAEDVGGRFSVLSPVGLFPATMAGIDIRELLAGARAMEERCRTEDIWRNPALMGAALHFIADTRKGLNIAVMMPYSDALSKVGFWFRQLWAESLGKSTESSGRTVNVGQTPVAAFGVTDQHSQLQLYQEGPFNKMITFLLVEDQGATMPIPSLDGIPEFSHLAGRSLAELMNIEAEATRFALTRAGRSNMSIILPEVNPFTVGQLLFMLQAQTVFAGGLYGVNPLDQPGVESSKDYIYGLTGRKGFEDKASEINRWQESDGRHII